MSNYVQFVVVLADLLPRRLPVMVVLRMDARNVRLTGEIMGRHGQNSECDNTPTRLEKIGSYNNPIPR